MSPSAKTPPLRRLVAGIVRSLWDPMAISVLSRRYAVEDHASHATGLLIDVGAGGQQYRPILAPRVDRYVACDIAPDATQTAKPHFAGDASALPIADRAADTILAASVLMYLESPQRAFVEFARALKAGGKLIAVAQHIRGESAEPDDRWRFSRRGLALLASSAGLEVLAVEPCTGLFGTTGHIWSQWLYGTLAARPWFPSILARALSAVSLVPSWILDKTGWGSRYTMYWLLVAQKP